MLLNCTPTLVGLFGQSATVPGSMEQQPMYMLTYDHGGLILWGSEHFRERLRDASTWLDRYPGFKIGIDNEAHMYDLTAATDPALLGEINSMLRDYPGRFGIGSSTYGQPLSQFICEESNIRQVGYALKSMQEHFGFKPSVYLMSEHAMHSQIPQIISGFGFKGAIMRTHFMMYGFNPTYNESFGWWIGMDGSRIPAVPTYVGEGAEFFKTTVDNWILTRYPGDDSRESLQDYRERFAHINPLLASRADDSGLRKEELVREVEGNPMFRWILLEELMDLYPDPVAEFRTLPDDFTVRMPWGYCGNSIWNKSRKAEIAVLTAERLAALEFINQGRNREDQLHQAWKNLLVAQHHDVQIVGLTSDAEKFLNASLQSSEAVLDSSMKWAAGHMSAEGRQQVTIFNPLSWERTEWVETSLSFEKGIAHAVVVSRDGEEVPVSHLLTHRYSDGSIFETTVVFAASLPPLCLTSYSVEPVSDEREATRGGVSVDRSSLVINTPYYRVKLNESGGIRSLENQESNASYFDPGQRSACFYGVIDGEELESSGRWVISRTHEGSPWVLATEYGFIGDIPYTLTLKFYSNKPRIDCNVDFRFDGQEIGQLSQDQRDRVSPFIHDKKLRFKCFPLLSGAATAIKDLPFVVTETTQDNVEGNYWTAVADQQRGVAYFNKGTMGSVRETDGGFSIPLSYAMYYIWGTRMLQGEYQYEFAIYPFEGPWQEADLHREAIAYNFPAVALAGDPGNGILGSRVDLLEIPSEHVLLSALYTDGNRIMARMYESAGTGTIIPLAPINKGYQMLPVDFSGEPAGKSVQLVPFSPWQIKTFELKKK